MAAFIGIDLGTTFSAVARIDENGVPAIVHNSEGSNVTPSVVEFRGDGVVDVGELPRKMLGLEDNIFGAFKREMGTDTTYEAHGKTYTPTQLSTFVLKKLKQDAEASLGLIGEAIVTTPANFPHEARVATMAAAKEAGLNVNYIINEPTAAALYYAFKNGKEFDGCCAIYDLGGGTFDVTIAKVVGQDVEVLATEGVKTLGGGDFDMELQKLVTTKYKEKTGKEPAALDFTKNDAEDLKKSLSKRERGTARVGLELIEVSREEFEEAISTLIAKTEMLCQSALAEAGVSVNEVKHVLFAGGSTRVPVVVASATKLFQQEPVSTANVDEVVAMGAALYAIYKGDEEEMNEAQKDSAERMKIQDRTSRYFGTLALSSSGISEMKNVVIIPKGEKVPCQAEKPFYTVKDGQTKVRCEVTESGTLETVPDFVKIIWEGDLPLPPGRPANQEIKVKFSYDENQIMNCQFVDVQTGKETEVELTIASDPSQVQDIDQFLVT